MLHLLISLSYLYRSDIKSSWSSNPQIMTTTTANHHSFGRRVSQEIVEAGDRAISPTAASDDSKDVLPLLPDWVSDKKNSWGELLDIPEWKLDDDAYRSKHGWKVSAVSEGYGIGAWVFLLKKCFFQQDE